MSYIEIILLAIALSVDAFVVSFTYGLISSEKRFVNKLCLAGVTGFFQGAMPVLGYYLTSIIRELIQPYAKWIVFSIFVFLGIKFILESFQKHQHKCISFNFLCLFLIGIATSIDAFSAGISLALYHNKILKPAILIAFITFINSSFGFDLGGCLKKIPSRWLEISAGIILILLGFKAVIAV